MVLRTSRSSGPGGQHANVTASRVEASFDVLASRVAQRGSARQRCWRAPARGSWRWPRTSARRPRNRELALARLAERIAGRSPCRASRAPHASHGGLARAAPGGQAPQRADASCSAAAHRRDGQTDRVPRRARAQFNELPHIALVADAPAGRAFGVEVDRVPQQPRRRRPGDDQVDAEDERGGAQPARAPTAPPTAAPTARTRAAPS